MGSSREQSPYRFESVRSWTSVEPVAVVEGPSTRIRVHSTSRTNSRSPSPDQFQTLNATTFVRPDGPASDPLVQLPSNFVSQIHSVQHQTLAFPAPQTAPCRMNAPVVTNGFVAPYVASAVTVAPIHNDMCHLQRTSVT